MVTPVTIKVGGMMGILEMILNINRRARRLISALASRCDERRSRMKSSIESTRFFTSEVRISRSASLQQSSLDNSLQKRSIVVAFTRDVADDPGYGLSNGVYVKV